MGTTKKTVAAAKKAAVDTTAKVEEVKAVEVTEVKATETKAVAKKTTAKKATVKADAAEKKEATMKVAIQYGEKNYTTEDLAKIANDVWVYDYGKDVADLNDIQLYVKTEESKVYYVFNGEIAGDFNI